MSKLSRCQQKNKEQMSYQGTETCHFGFEVRNEVLVKSRKLAVLVFEAITKAR